MLLTNEDPLTLRSLPGSEDKQQVLSALRLQGTTESLAVAHRKRSCYQARTRTECILDFASRIKIMPSGCWEWYGFRFKSGHGAVKFMGKLWHTHRLMFFLSTGQHPQSGFVCHHCDNGACVNPVHLYLGNAKTNAEDREFRGRGKQLRGSANGKAKLSEADVLAIRESFIPFMVTRKMLATRFNVRERTIKAVLSFQNWSHLGAGTKIPKATSPLD